MIAGKCSQIGSRYTPQRTQFVGDSVTVLTFESQLLLAWSLSSRHVKRQGYQRSSKIQA